ncbi:lytic transglycosylase domain-containing protein [Alteribacillus sp. HJP-4]|uniref:lytic transglycosylase domain-containing protein n=1 Tax=Alteribacillus sp. HJP-4 TaxID=2775394 RepID=UPI0035CD0A04
MPKRKRKHPVLSVFVMTVTIIVILGIIIHSSLPESFTRDQYYSNEQIPAEFIPIYQEAGDEYDISWKLLAAVHRVESVFSTMSSLESPAGAVGHMQFMPCTFIGWSYPGCAEKGSLDIPENELHDTELIKNHGGYGVDGNGDGRADPYNVEDAIHSAANFLASNGAAEGDKRHAVYQYNHADWYVEEVLEYERTYYEKYESVQSEQTTGINKIIWNMIFAR